LKGRAKLSHRYGNKLRPGTVDWTELETSTFQDHVIKHVLGATVLGWIVIGDAVHLLLDVGLLWTIYVTAEMDLMAQSVAIQDLAGDAVSDSDILQFESDAQLLKSEGREATGLVRLTAAPVECVVCGVAIFSSDSRRRIMIEGEHANIEITTNLDSSEVTIKAISRG
jgi:hypothetical protein